MARIIFNPFTGSFDYIVSTLAEVDDVESSVLPTKGSLLAGDGSLWQELGVGTNNYVLIADSTQPLGVRWSAAAPGAGDVVGPGSSTDNALVRFDGATGKLLQNSGVIVDDSDNLTLPGTLNGVQHFASGSADPGVPTPADGDRYFNTSLKEDMRYDGSRSKWLSVGSLNVQAGRRGNTLAGSYYRAVDGMTFDGGHLGVCAPKGTLVYLGWSKGSAATATLEVLVGGVVVTTLTNPAAGSVASLTVNADFDAGNMSFRNQTGGSTTTDVQVFAVFKRRV